MEGEIVSSGWGLSHVSPAYWEALQGGKLCGLPDGAWTITATWTVLGSQTLFTHVECKPQTFTGDLSCLQ